MKNIAVVIPARLNSTRIKHKMLMKFDDEPLIRLVFDKVRMMGYDTFVATDSKRIAKLFPIKWCIQTGKADNGTHRLSKRAVLDLVSSYDYVLNIQGDMLDINIDTMKPIIKALNEKDVVCLTAYTKGAKPDDVKVIHQNGKAMWFTRSDIGYGDRHLGIYAYKPYLLKAYRVMKDKYKSENLEQNRILGLYDVDVVETTYDGIEVNTYNDIK
jgi:3-deoxy-manno-octulosonate cytidylyltransferase (CMP-KDO synthetase)|tara:strand:- start:744 stop:1382 length:639 start_codon:yes stop_codon:yes gene_type:complete